MMIRLVKRVKGPTVSEGQGCIKEPIAEVMKSQVFLNVRASPLLCCIQDMLCFMSSKTERVSFRHSAHS